MSTIPDMSSLGTPHRLGWAVRKVRKAQGLTLEAVGGEIGSDAANLSRMERGQQEITEATLNALASVFEVSPSSLWRLAETHDTDPNDSGRVLAMAGLMKPDQLAQFLDYGQYLLDKPTK